MSQHIVAQERMLEILVASRSVLSHRTVV